MQSPSRPELIRKLEGDFSRQGIRRRKRRRLSNSLSWIFLVRILGTLKRLFDATLAVLLLILLSPLLLPIFIVTIAKGRALIRTPRLGRWATEFQQLRFNLGPRYPDILAALPGLFNLLKGDLSFIGPRALSAQDATNLDRLAWKRYDIRPGLICLWWLRKRANIAYGSEAQTDADYVNTYTFWGDLGIALRAIPALAYGEGVSEAPDRVTLLGIRVDNLTMSEAVVALADLAQQHHPSQVSFVNADCVNIAFRDKEYRSILEGSRLVLADGIGIKLAGKFLNQNIRENVNGSDLLPFLLAELEKRDLGVFLLGGKPGIADDCASWATAQYPDLRICGTQHGYFLPAEEAQVIDSIRQSGARVLLAAFGAPRQEKWIDGHREALGVSVQMGVGGLLDFYSGRLPRAPLWMRELAVEWLFRFWQEPRRMWRRYLIGNLVFLSRVFREYLRSPQSAQPGLDR
jgi:N-acetylglucosaminyldiphosphoundecaprenol N-acetyl-beta-D-mannosaminyltransferase